MLGPIRFHNNLKITTVHDLCKFHSISFCFKVYHKLTKFLSDTCCIGKTLNHKIGAAIVEGFNSPWYTSVELKAVIRGSANGMQTNQVNGHTQLLLPPALNVAFRFLNGELESHFPMKNCSLGSRNLFLPSQFFIGKQLCDSWFKKSECHIQCWWQK